MSEGFPDTKRRIIETIEQSKPSLSLTELANKLGLDRLSVAYYIGILEDEGKVVSRYILLEAPTESKMGKVKRVFEPDAPDSPTKAPREDSK